MNSKAEAEQILSLLRPGGPLSVHFKGFEPRQGQQQMASDAIQAYQKNSIALIEAGTGIGKSLAYLLPALYWAVNHKERTVISTNTIALQEQLIHKDIPQLIKMLNWNVKAVLVKGMNNYVCLRKLEDAKQQILLYSAQEGEEIRKIDKSLTNTTEGSRSEFPFVCSGNVWEQIGAERDTCNAQECPYYQDCYFFKARKQANDAQLLVVNHHLLFADLANRHNDDNYESQSVLPLYSRIVIDEAHHIEDVATEFFASQISFYGVQRTLGRLAGDKQGKLLTLKDKLQHFFKKEIPIKLSSILSRLTIELPAFRRDITTLLQQLLQAFASFKNDIQRFQATRSDKLRLISHHYSHSEWIEHVIPNTKKLIETLKRYHEMITNVETDIRLLKNEQFDEQTKSLRFEISALGERLNEVTDVLAELISSTPSTASVRWIESSELHDNVQAVIAQIDISRQLVDCLFNKFGTIILCSATLTTNQQFDFMRQRMGLTTQFSQQRNIHQAIYESPFDYQKQALFAVPSDLPDPTHEHYIPAVTEMIWRISQASNGNAFVLFTSYQMLQQCHQLLADRLQAENFNVLKQGDNNRRAMIAQFKHTNRSVLFGTDSFWEGVDIAGDALRCVIITKLPFKVPTEPIIQARTEYIQAQGKDPFFEYALPQAIVKFKQGWGRLIRTKKDRGCIVCLDPRILTKGYGKQIINSLPSCQTIFAPADALQEPLVDFYRKTYYLTK